MEWLQSLSDMISSIKKEKVDGLPSLYTFSFA